MICNRCNSENLKDMGKVKEDGKVKRVLKCLDCGLLFSAEKTPPVIMNRHKGTPLVILQIENGVVVNSYPSIVRASEETGISKTSIWECVNGKKSSAGGFCWQRMLG